jgi:hypothetical protein
MSRSDSTTIVNVVNTNIFINEVNNAGQNIGMGPVSPTASIDKAAQQYNAALQAKLLTSYNAVFGSALPGENQDNGYMGPIQNLVPGDAPQCVVDQVNQDFSVWGLPGSTDIGTVIAKSITLHLANQGGVTNFASGSLQVTSNETIAWMAYFGTFSIEAGEQSELGAVYAFGAALQF